MNLNRSDLIDLVAKEKSHRKYEVRAITEDLFDLIRERLSYGDRVTIRGFGSFEVRRVKGHPAVHPTTGERITVGDYTNVVFRPGEELLRSVRDTSAEEIFQNPIDK